MKWVERVVVDEIIGDDVRVAIGKGEEGKGEREEYLSVSEYRNLVDLATHERLIEGDVHVIEYEIDAIGQVDSALKNDLLTDGKFANPCALVKKRVRRDTENARRRIIELHKRVFGGWEKKPSFCQKLGF